MWAVIVENNRRINKDSFECELGFLFQSFVEQSNDAIYFKDSRNCYRYINPAGARMLGRIPEEVVGKTDFDVVSRELAEKMWARDRFIMRGNDSHRTYEDEDTINGQRVVFQTTKSPLRNIYGDVLGLIGVSRDITAQKVQEAEHRALIESLSQAKRQLEEERELRQKLVANLGHDLRSPLSVAKMASQLIEGAPTTSELAQNFLLRLRCALDRVDAMIRDLLDSSRAEAGHDWSFTKTNLDLKAVLLDCLQALSVIYPDRLKFTGIEEMAPAFGVWEKSALQRIVENLVHNAIRHGDSQAPVTIRAAVDSEAGEACFTVHNFGPAIAASPEELFLRFRREKTAKAGWGLGLTIVKSLVEGHGGRIEVQSEEGAGTSFTVHLPLSLCPI